MFFDDTESRLYREQKALFISIGNDGIDNIVKKFYYKNSNLIDIQNILLIQDFQNFIKNVIKR